MPDGRQLFQKNCVICHGADGRLGLNGAKDLTQSALTLEQRIQLINHGRAPMPAFEQTLSAAEIEAVAIFTHSLNSNSNK